MLLAPLYAKVRFMKRLLQVSIVIATQSIPTELLIPAQFLKAFQARGGTGIRSCLKSSPFVGSTPTGPTRILLFFDNSTESGPDGKALVC